MQVATCTGAVNALRSAKAQIVAGMHLPRTGSILFAIGDESQRLDFAPLARRAAKLGYQVYATHETQKAWSVIKPSEFCTPCAEANAAQRLQNGMIQLLISVDTRRGSTEESTLVRRAGLAAGVPYFTRLTNTRALLGALEALALQEQPSVHALQGS